MVCFHELFWDIGQISWHPHLFVKISLICLDIVSIMVISPFFFCFLLLQEEPRLSKEGEPHGCPLCPSNLCKVVGESISQISGICCSWWKLSKSIGKLALMHTSFSRFQHQISTDPFFGCYPKLTHTHVILDFLVVAIACCSFHPATLWSQNKRSPVPDLEGSGAVLLDFGVRFTGHSHMVPTKQRHWIQWPKFRSCSAGACSRADSGQLFPFARGLCGWWWWRLLSCLRTSCLGVLVRMGDPEKKHEKNGSI